MLLMLANRDKKLLEQLGASEQVSGCACVLLLMVQPGAGSSQARQEGPVRDPRESLCCSCKQTLCCPHVSDYTKLASVTVLSAGALPEECSRVRCCQKGAVGSSPTPMP